MATVVGVRFQKVGKVYYFDPADGVFSCGDRVIVETARGIECGEVALANREVPEEEVVRPLKSVIRRADEEEDVDRQMDLLREACLLYKGELLPGSSEEEWVLIESVQCKKMYSGALQQLCDYLWDKKEYEDILDPPSCLFFGKVFFFHD